MINETPFYQWKTPNTLVLKIRVFPGSKNTAFGEVENGVLRVLIKAMPKDNEANEALIKFLSKTFKTPQLNILICSGSHSKDKILIIENPKKLPDIINPAV